MPEPVEEFSEAWKQFFMSKILQGMKSSNDELSREDIFFLAGHVDEVKVKPKDAKPIVARCIKALTAAYNRDVTPEKPKEFDTWRDNNTKIYRNSYRMLDCIVQMWYITDGQALERNIRKTRALYTWYSPDAAKLWDNYFAGTRPPKP